MITTSLGVLVVSSEDVIVQCINVLGYTADAFHVPLLSQLGFAHVAMMYKSSISDRFQGPYEIGVVATQTSTTVQVAVHGPNAVTVSFGGETHTNGAVIVISLDKFETAQVWLPGWNLKCLKYHNIYTDFSIVIFSFIDIYYDLVPFFNRAGICSYRCNKQFPAL